MGGPADSLTLCRMQEKLRKDCGQRLGRRYKSGSRSRRCSRGVWAWCLAWRGVKRISLFNFSLTTSSHRRLEFRPTLNFLCRSAVSIHSVDMLYHDAAIRFTNMIDVEQQPRLVLRPSSSISSVPVSSAYASSSISESHRLISSHLFNGAATC